MQEPPPITITDPGRPPEPADVLVAGSERPPLRVPRRLLVIGTAAALVVVGSVVGLHRWDAHQVAVRRAAAAFARADTVHAHLALLEGGVYAETPPDIVEPNPGTGVDPGTTLPSTGTLAVPLGVTDDDASLTEVRDVRVTGSGVRAVFDPTLWLGRVPGSGTPLAIPVTFPCSDVAAGRYPVLTGLVVVLVPESGREHRVTVPVTTTPALALEACLLPDPAAVPETTIEEQHGRLLLTVSSIPRSRHVLEVLAITSPGFALKLVGGMPGRPVATVPPNTAEVLEVSVRVTDCAAARVGSEQVTALLAEGARRWTVVVPDYPANELRLPGSAVLQRAVRSACH